MYGSAISAPNKPAPLPPRHPPSDTRRLSSHMTRNSGYSPHNGKNFFLNLIIVIFTLINVSNSWIELVIIIIIVFFVDFSKGSTSSRRGPAPPRPTATPPSLPRTPVDQVDSESLHLRSHTPLSLGSIASLHEKVSILIWLVVYLFMLFYFFFLCFLFEYMYISLAVIERFTIRLSELGIRRIEIQNSKLKGCCYAPGVRGGKKKFNKFCKILSIWYLLIKFFLFYQWNKIIISCFFYRFLMRLFSVFFFCVFCFYFSI